MRIGAAPCSWGVEFPDTPENPPWLQVLRETKALGYKGIELGPVGYMPEDPLVLEEALQSNNLELVGGVVFRPFHNQDAWPNVLDGVVRTCKALTAAGAERIVFIDSISPLRAPYAGRSGEAPRLSGTELEKFLGRIRTAAKISSEEYGLTVALHAHAGGFVEFEDEIEYILEKLDENLMKICLDSGHCLYAGYDPVAFYRRHSKRVEYLHFKDIDPELRERVITNRTGFYEACAQGLFCNLGRGAVNFSALKEALEEENYSGWATIEQDCDPAGDTTPAEDARINLDFLRSIQLSD